MKKYEEPLMDVTWYEEKNIICASGDPDEGPIVQPIVPPITTL